MKKFIPLLIFFVTLINSVYATSIDLNVPISITQGETVNAQLVVESDSIFNGVVNIVYNNTKSSINSVSVLNTSFGGSGPYRIFFGWAVEGINEGAYTIKASLYDEAGSLITSDISTGSVNSSAPIILSKSPSGFITTKSTTLNVVTNEKSTCRYGKEDTYYDNISNQFEYTGSTIHSQLIIDLSDGATSYYIRCKDLKAYKMNYSETISFVVDLPPSAEIDLNKNSPLTEGVVEVRLKSSETLMDVPILEYSFEDNPTSKRPVSLIWSGSAWVGYMIINQEYDNLIGTFYFLGKDALGTIGTTITQGKSFIVDTKKPVAPINVQATPKEDGSINIKWYYDGEEANLYKVYRSTSSDVNYINYYQDSENSTSYNDNSAEERATYYYRVAAVDKAGNVGELSETTYATSSGTGVVPVLTIEQKAQETPKLLPPNLVVLVEDENKRINQILLDIKSAEEDTESIDSEVKSLFGVSESINSGKNQLESLKKQLEELKKDYKTESELRAILDSIRLSAEKTKKTTLRKFEVLEKSEYVQGLNEEDLDLAIEQFFSDTSINNNFNKKDFRKFVLKLQSNVEVSARIYIGKTEFMDGTIKEQTLIKKSISYENEETLKDVVVYEIIPKDVAVDVSEINFASVDYEVVKADPIVKYGFVELPFKDTNIIYKIDSNLDSNIIKKTSTIILLSPIEAEKNKITSFAVSNFSIGSGTFSKISIFLVIAGIFAIIILGGYQFMLSNEMKPSDIMSFIAKIRGNLAYRRTPLPKVESKNNMYISASYDTISELINWAHKHIDNNESEKAKILYPKIEILYKNLRKEDKPKVFDECMKLQQRFQR